ncbi:hypothetical protein EYF80_005111 [Liparis tanakae]|uniref:Uncharacterized protein n=1 Tax=Liparis tanakae TaxID=230148 RepID=A0A4Z2J3C5_9TELE|nr:hypothetical protein EYF80_005111 [Liparis tanakae]
MSSAADSGVLPSGEAERWQAIMNLAPTFDLLPPTTSPAEGCHRGCRGFTSDTLLFPLCRAGARKAQLVKVQGGHKEEGAEQSWDGMGWSRLCWAGRGQRVQSWASSLQAMGSKPSPRVPGLLYGLHC